MKFRDKWGTQETLHRGNDLYAVFIKRAFTWSGVKELFCSSMSATAPLTAGVAMLVPLSRKSRCCHRSL